MRILGDTLTSYFADSILCVSIMSPLNLLHSRAGRSRILNLSSYDLFRKIEINFVALV